MSNGVEFDNDRMGAQQKLQSFGQPQSSSGITGWLIKRGIVKDESGAQKIQLAIVVVNIIIIFLIIRYFL